MMSIFLGTFTLAMAVLYLEVFATRVIAFVVGTEFTYTTVAVAMLGMSMAAAIVSLLPEPLDAYRVRLWAGGLCLGGSISTLLLFFGVRLIKGWMSGLEDVAIDRGGLNALGAVIWTTGCWCSPLIGLMLSGVYVLTGGALALMFRTTSAPFLSRLYAVDLAGACLGCLAAIGLLECGDYGPPLAVATGLPALAGMVFLPLSIRTRAFGVGACAILTLCVGVGPIAAALEPRPNLKRLVRSWEWKKSRIRIQELWHSWNSFGRISAVRVVPESGPPTHLMVHGNGEGHAKIPAVHETSDMFDISVACSPAQSVLVLFAGCGWDMYAIDRLVGGKACITGVELIPQTYEWPVSRSEFELRRFFARPGIRMELAEAREFLARDHAIYDSILLSRSGVPLNYVIGTARQQADYVYTIESLDSILNHLKPGGQVTVLSGNKIRLILTFRELLRRRGLIDTPRCFAVLSASEQAVGSFWGDFYDPRILVVKPAGFTEEDVRKLAKLRRLVYRPGASGYNDSAYAPAVLDDDIPGYLEELRTHFSLNLEPTTDDRPYLRDIVPAGVYLSGDFWRGFLSPRSWSYSHYHILTLLAFFVLSTGAAEFDSALQRGRDELATFILRPPVMRSGTEADSWYASR